MHERKNRNTYSITYEAFPLLEQTYYKDLVVHNKPFSLTVLLSNISSCLSCLTGFSHTNTLLCFFGLVQTGACVCQRVRV